ncbi:MAG: DNA polymerase IV [Actinomycetia bacterium]|nr:DNA polymerase IV [Actinomycetes bacterium]
MPAVHVPSRGPRLGHARHPPAVSSPTSTVGVDPPILHVDMDAFFVSVELLRRPELRGQPVVVGGAGRRGVVAAASYEARSYGVFSAMPSARARQLCPEAVFLAGEHELYGEVSKRVMAIFASFTPLVEPLSLDEAFLDVAGARRLHGEPSVIAHRIRELIHQQEGLTCSVGVAPTKFVAKLASEQAKPKPSRRGPVFGPGITVVRSDQLDGFLRPLPVEALWGVGPATLERLHRIGVRRVGQLADLPEGTVISSLGEAAGRHLHQLSRGIDTRRVEPDREVKSISHEETYPTDVFDRARLDRELVRMADGVATRLRGGHLAGRTISIKVRFGDFTTLSRSITADPAVDSMPVITERARALLDEVPWDQGVRLLGVGVSNLTDGAVRQLTLDDAAGPSWGEADKVVDEIRSKWGSAAIGPAAIVTPELGVQVKRRGDQAWGPDETR